jgi:hypothetical protein
MVEADVEEPDPPDFRSWLCVGQQWHGKQFEDENNDTPDSFALHGRLLCHRGMRREAPTVRQWTAVWYLSSQIGGNLQEALDTTETTASLNAKAPIGHDPLSPVPLIGHPLALLFDTVLVANGRRVLLLTRA